MKKQIITLGLALIMVCMPSATYLHKANAVAPAIVSAVLGMLGIGGGKDKTSKQRLVALKNILDKQKKHLTEMRRINEQTQNTEFNTMAAFELASDIEEILRSAKQFATIKDKDTEFNTLAAYVQIRRETAGYFSDMENSSAFLNKLDQTLNQGVERNGLWTSFDLYDELIGGSDLNSGVKDMNQLQEARLGELSKVLAMQTAAQKKKFVQAIHYYKLADQLYKQGLLLSDALNDESNGEAVDVEFNERFGKALGNPDLSDPFAEGGLFSALGGIQQMLSTITDLAQGDIDAIMDAVKNMEAQEMADIGGALGTVPFFPVEMTTPTQYKGKNKGLRLTVGERIESQNAAIQMVEKSYELREHGDNLMMEALEKTDLQKSLEKSRMQQFLRKSFIKLDNKF